MAIRKPRAKSEKAEKLPKPLLQLDPQRWEEISAIGVFILAALTALGAFNLSEGYFLKPWVEFLRTLFGWGVYLAPFLLIGLSIWLFLDALDKTVDIGWERPIGLVLGFLLMLATLHWLTALVNPLEWSGKFQGGGIIGWGIVYVLVKSLGSVGAFLALVAAIGVTLILLFNISLPELARRIVFLGRVMGNLPQELKQFGKKPSAPPTSPPSPSPEEFNQERGKGAGGLGVRTEMPRPVAARIIGGTATSPSPVSAPVIEREWRLPNIAEILEESTEQEISQQEIRARVRVIEETLQHFGVPARVIEVNQGPTITQFGVEPGFIEQRGVDAKLHRVKVKVSRISALQHDLELALAAAPIRIEAPVPGRNIVGIEVPNSHVAMVSLRSVMESDRFKNMKSKLRLALGQDVSGQPIVADLATMPHLLIAGATGSGKSVCINTVIGCLLATTTPAEVRFIMIDPKRVELVNFNGIPHMSDPVVVEVERAVAALQGAVQEMDRRFKLFARMGARNIDIYNHMIENKPEAVRLPLLVVIVDELADLMMVAAEEVERAITRLAQMARATGIHLILATQRPSVDVVTGLIKANFPSRISFAVTSQIDSRVVLDSPGAEKLLGRGDMLYMASDSSKLVRLQGCFVSDRELEKIVTWWKGFTPPPPSAETDATTRGPVVQKALWEDPTLAPGFGEKDSDGGDDLLPQAVEIVKQNQRASASLLQRKLRIGYTRAARLMELMQERGIVGPDEGPTRGRAVFSKEITPARSSAPSSKMSSRSKREFAEEENFDDWTDEDWADLDKE